jgi:hypothetical protein
VQLNSILSRMPLYPTVGHTWSGTDGFIDRKLNLRVTPCDDYASATIGKSGDKVLTLADYLVEIISEARVFDLDRLIIHNRTGSPFEKQDFPFALSRTPSSAKFKRIAVVETFESSCEWTGLDVAFGRIFKVSVRLFPDAFDAVRWLCGE